MGIALYRQYRPKKLSEIIGQEHITTTLTNALKTGQLSHAYLFTGPRGVGKTSVARILAHEVNNLPYSDESDYLDIIEIDAASNRRIDEIRQLRERINLAPTSAKYKVYIIDEVHMLTREAFNALLKTLEEPPEHVIFILATTEAYKVPETIISRTQQFNFKPISVAQMVIQLKKIAKIEKIDIDEASLKIIAEYGEGSFRDSLSLLDQASSVGTKITQTEIDKILGMAPSERIKSIIKAIEKGSVKELFALLDELYGSGYNVSIVSKQILLELRQSLTSHSLGMPDTEILELMKRLIEVPMSSDPDTLLEVILLSSAISKGSDSAKNDGQNDEKQENAEVQPEQITKSTKIINSDEKGLEADSPKSQTKFTVDIWPEVLNAVRNKHNTLYGVARMAVPSIDKDTLTLTTKFEFHEKALNDEKNKKIISDIVHTMTGKRVLIVLVVDKKLELSPPTEDKVEEIDSLSTINNIFGGAEVLE